MQVLMRRTSTILSHFKGMQSFKSIPSTPYTLTSLLIHANFNSFRNGVTKLAAVFALGTRWKNADLRKNISTLQHVNARNR